MIYLNKRKSYLLALLLTAVMLTGCGSRIEKAAAPEPSAAPTAVSEAPASPAAEPAAAEAAPSGGGLRIEADSLRAEPLFIDVEEDGTAMQLIALRDAGGAVRLAFNTCQSCGGSPYAWFEDMGDGRLQCQNCHQTFPLETVGTPGSKGCSPVPITEWSMEDGIVTVPEALLKENTERFANWKMFD